MQRELPSNSVYGVTLGHRSDDLFARDAAAGLVLPQLGDATHVPLVAGEWRLDERIDEQDRLIHTVLPSADRDQVRVIVLARKTRGRDVPDQCRARSANLVGCHLLAVDRK